MTKYNPTFEIWKRLVPNANVYQDFLDQQFWIEANSNYPKGEGNAFLMAPHVRHTAQCVGGVDKEGKDWVATVNKLLDEDGSDVQEIGRSPNRDEAIQILWNKRHQAYWG